MKNDRSIAILTSNFGGTTLPLAKHFADAGYHVDFYANSSVGKMRELEATDVVPFETPEGISSFPIGSCEALKKYLGENVSLWACSFYRPFRKVPVVRNIMRVIRRAECRKVCGVINARNYDFAIIVTQYFDDQFIDHLRFLNCKTITILHEVVNHLNPDYEHLSPLLRYLFSNKKHIVLHSINSYNDIQKYKECTPELLHHINYGLFETYRTLRNNHMFSLSVQYLLYFGVIRPYKGLSVIYDAIKKHPDCLNGYKIVIAGSGKDEASEKMKSDSHFIVINKFLSNNEVVELAEGASALLCPYLSVSQSGIPQTMYVFNKPIIASDLDGFKEIVQDGHNGILFQSGNPDALAEAISSVTKDEIRLRKLCEGVESFETDYPEYNWNHIVKQYINLADII